jgi:hypothetical protein
MNIDEIAERLALSRTTIYHWLRDLPIERSARPRTVAQINGNLAMQAKYRQLREAAYAEGRESFDELAADPSFRDFVCLYPAEGSKRHRNYVSVCNSDPAVVVLCNAWLRRLSARTLDYGVQYHADQDLDERKSNSNQLKGRTWRSVHGVLTVRVCDTLLRAKLNGWMDRLRESWL